MEPAIFLVLFLAGLIGSSFGVLIGGQSLLTLPLLILLGVHPHQAIATNLFGVVATPLTGWFKFHQKKLINYDMAWALVIPSIIGSILGTFVILHVDAGLLKKVISGLTVILLILILKKPGLGINNQKQKATKTYNWLAFIVSFCLGIYGAFYTAGVGTLFSYLLILGFGYTYLESTATQKIALSFLFITATIIYIYRGLVIYPFAIALFLGNMAGSYVGAHYSDTIGNKWLMRAFSAMVIIMAIQIFFQ